MSDSAAPAVEAAGAPAGSVDVVSPDAQLAQDVPAQMEIVLLIPAQSFVAVPHLTATPKAGSPDVLELPINIAPSEATVAELRQLITENPEGFWLGSFGLVPVEAKQVKAAEGESPAEWGPWSKLEAPEQSSSADPVDPTMWRYTGEGVLGDFMDLSAVFSGVADGVRRGLQVVPTSFAPLSISLHLLRVRDTLYSSLSLLSDSVSYDPSSIAIGAGASLYVDVCGKPDVAASVEVEAEDVKGKKGKTTKKEEPAAPASAAESTPAAPVEHPFTNWTLDDLTSSGYLEKLRPSSTSALSTPCLKSFGISPWSPPPHPRRMRGDLAYLVITTLEGETFHITGATSGFWVSRGGASNFDPLPRVPAPKGLKATPYHSLFELFVALSPLFHKSLVQLLKSQNPVHDSQSELFAALPITHATPAAPWMVPAPVHSSDPFRTQLAYLLTGATTAELLPPARDWNDEITQYRALPQKNLPERLLRERQITRVQADFVSAATRGALSIARGDVPPLNPSEPEEAHTFMTNNMLFTRADDALGAHAHIGGNEASRVAASKDLAGVNLLERIDDAEINSMLTVLVDYCGERWVVQSLLPGLFRTKEDDEALKKEGGDAEKPYPVYPVDSAEERKAADAAQKADKPYPSLETPSKDDYPSCGVFRIAYGSGNPEQPDEKIRSSAYFHLLAKRVGEQLKLAEHNVYDRDGNASKLWTSADMHGIAAPDGRSYFIDCYRLHCVDVEFLENQLDGPLVSDIADSHVNGVHTPASYPHRLPLLRVELLEAYRQTKLGEWVEERAKEIQARSAKKAASEPAAGSIESELKEAASDEKKEEKVEEEDASSKYIHADDFHLEFNPDAFVERKSSSHLAYDPEEESTKNVRLASKFLREVALPHFVVQLVTSASNHTDGIYLTKQMHEAGINMRYLGILAGVVDNEGPTLEYGRSVSKAEVLYHLRLINNTLQHEMVIRASKHILRRLLKASATYDHPALIAHFYNCLLGTSLEPKPSPELIPLPAGVSSERLWASLTPASIRDQIVSEVESRFRYSLPTSFFTSELVANKVLRELSLRVGVQLAVREYNFGSADAVPAVEEEKVEAAPETPAADKKKKKKKAATKVEKVAVASSREQAKVTFLAEDVLNIMPIVRTTVHHSDLADDQFAIGYQQLAEGKIELGAELIQDAFTLYEQIFGSVHPEAAQRYHRIGLLYNQLASAAIRKVHLHEVGEMALKDLNDKPADYEYSEQEKEAKRQAESFLIAEPELVRQQVEAHLNQAVRMLRESVVISERVNGLDAAETIQQYTDLSLLELHSGNPKAALPLAKHALALWSAVYGVKHHSVVTLLGHVATMVQSLQDHSASVPVLLECRAALEALYGRESINFAVNEKSLAEAFAVTGQLAECLPYAKEAARLYSQLLGAEARDTVEMTQLSLAVENAIAREGQEKKANEERLKKKFPKLMEGRVAKPKAGVAASTSTAPAVEAVAAAKKEHGQKASQGLSVDELVNFIQGPAPRSSKKKTNSPPARS
ncbi:eukaryotic translation initiation factor 3 subunit CLU1/TIF31 [Pseudohyphozyma bogoriensis]|nr:eukaryotic translation initiation factor 3 subunit CLU1/TIF31 [Pseudohyphozyma bogoriensis]